MQVIPSILVKSYEELEQLVRRYEPHVQRVQMDIIDGEFAPEATIVGYDELPRIGTQLAFDIHLMVKRPEEVLERWYATKADRIILHAESEGDLAHLLVDIKEHGKRAALALNPETPLSRIGSLIPHCDFVQFMTVHPGSYGAGFLSEVIPKIIEFHAVHPQVTIAVDGGIVPETAQQVLTAGASLLVVGSYLKNASDIAQALTALTTSP